MTGGRREFGERLYGSDFLLSSVASEPETDAEIVGILTSSMARSRQREIKDQLTNRSVLILSIEMVD